MVRRTDYHTVWSEYFGYVVIGNSWTSNEIIVNPAVCGIFVTRTPRVGPETFIERGSPTSIA